MKGSRLTVLVSLALHAGVFAALVRGEVHGKVRPVEITELAEVEVEAPPIVETATAPGEEGVVAPSAATPNAVGRPLEGAVATPSAAEPNAAPTSTTAPAEPSASGNVILFAPPVVGGVGAANPFVMSAGPVRPGASADSLGRRPVEAKTAAEAKAAVEQSIRTASHERDTTLGLGPEGPVVTALSDATRGSLAPDRGSAVFLAIVDANGLVTDLKLLSSRGGDEGWKDAHKRAAQALTGKKLALRGAKGAHLQIEISSDMKLPSGGSAPISVSPGGPGSPQAPGGRFDVADIGSSAHRVVHARLLSATML